MYQGTQRGQSSSLSPESSFHSRERQEENSRQALDKLNDGIPFLLNVHPNTQAQTETEHPEEYKSNVDSPLRTVGLRVVLRLLTCNFSFSTMNVDYSYLSRGREGHVIL